ncbi:MAG: phosphoribosylformylglycinamidine synthase I [Vulcanimicrobiaceae bacterium]
MASARVAVVVFPGTNSEEETLRALAAVGLDARPVRSNAEARELRTFDAYVLPGGFAYEDRVRAGAIAAHDRALEAIREADAAGKPILGLCNGAQILLEAGIVPALGDARAAQAAFAKNAPLRKFRSVRVWIRLAVRPARSPLLAALPEGAVLPAWASHGEGRLAASQAVLAQLEPAEVIAFRYCDAGGAVRDDAVPNGSALGVAGLLSVRGNALALMPHPERAAWAYQLLPGTRSAVASGDGMLAPAGGIALFASFARGLAA